MQAQNTNRSVSLSCATILPLLGGQYSARAEFMNVLFR
jgi:hypothetical protein